LEWSYHKKDEFGIKIAVYAQFAINKKYGNLQNKEFMKSFRESKLLKYFLDLEGNRSIYWKKYRTLANHIVHLKPQLLNFLPLCWISISIAAHV